MNTRSRPSVERLEPREVPTVGSWTVENFDTVPTGQLPAGWSTWQRVDRLAVFSTDTHSNAATGSTLASAGRSYDAARAWQHVAAGTPVELSLDIYADSLIPLQLIAQGSGLDGGKPNYYAVMLRRGLHVELQRVADGQFTTVAAMDSAKYLSQEWVRVTLHLDGTTLRARVLRTTTNQYLTADGGWQAEATYALEATVDALPNGTAVGVIRPAHYAGKIHVDNFAIRDQEEPSPIPIPDPDPNPEPGPIPDPTPEPTSIETGVWQTWTDGRGATATRAAITATTNGVGVARAWSQPTADVTELNAMLDVDGAATATLFLRGSDLAHDWANYFGVSVSRSAGVQLVLSSAASSFALESVKPTTWPADGSLRVRLNVVEGVWNVEIVRTDTGAYLTGAGRWQTARAAALTATDDSLATDGSYGIEVSGGAGHVAVATLSVAAGPTPMAAVNDTPPTAAAAKGVASDPVALAPIGGTVQIASGRSFSTLVVNVAQSAGADWASVFEYPSAADRAGRPTRWSRLLVHNTTSGWTRDGLVTFDAPADWTPIATGDAERMYVLRIRTVAAGNPPVAWLSVRR